MIMTNIFHPFRVRKAASDVATAIDADNLKRLQEAAKEADRIKDLLKLDKGATMRISLALGYRVKKNVR